MAETTLVELNELLPADVGLVVSTLNINRLSKGDIDVEVEALETAASSLSRAHANVIAMSGGPIVYLANRGGDIALVDRLERASGVSSFHDVSAVRDELIAAGCRNIAVVSPFTREINAGLVEYLAQRGISVLGVESANVSTNVEIRAIPWTETVRLGRRAISGAPRVDAVFITCAGWCSLPAARELEADFGIPVITQPRALARRALAVLGINRAVEGILWNGR